MNQQEKSKENIHVFQSQFLFPPFCYLYWPPPHILQQALQQQTKDQVKVEEESEVKQEVKEEYESSPQNASQKSDLQSKKINKKKVHIYPGETKNFYKNVGQKLSNYIVNNFSAEVIKEDNALQNFVRTDSQKFNRLTLEKLLRSKFARKIICYFFGNFQWALPFITQNKTDLEFYFRNQIYQKREKKP